MTMYCYVYILLIFSLLNFCPQAAYANLKFSNPSSTIVIHPTNSFLGISNVSKVSGWSEESIVKAFGNNSPSQWVEGYTNNVVIAQTGGTAVPHTNLIYSNSNAINSADQLIVDTSNSVVYLDRRVRTDSNAFIYGIKNNSNAIIKLGITERTNSNAFAYGIKNNSNAIIKLGIIERTNSNAFAYGIKNNSNAIVKLSQASPSGLLVQTSNAVNALSPVVKGNSNAILSLSSREAALETTVRTNSNAFAYGIKNNSNTLLVLNRTTSNALLFGDRNNSNAIIKLGVTERTNSNAFAYGIKNNSNAIVKLSQASPSGLLVQTSNAVNALSPVVKGNSNAILSLSSREAALETTVRTNSNAFAYGIKNNSNTLLALNRTTSNALLFGNRNNSNAIIKLGVTGRTNSNAFAYGIKNNSNAIIKLCVIERTNSNAFAYGIKNNSNSIIKLSQGGSGLPVNNSNAIIALNRTLRVDSNAFAYGIKNNSNAIIKLSQGGSIALATQNSNAIVSWIKGTSNAVIKLSGTAPAVLPINNSNAIIKLNASLQTIDHGPNAIQINTPTYTMTYDFYLSIDHILNIQNSCIFDGNGHTIYFAKDSPNILIIAAGNVVLNNVVLKNFDDSSVQLGGGATLTFGDGCRVDLADEQSMTMPWIFAGNSAINGCGNPLELGLQNIQIMQSGNLTIENIILEGLQNNNVRCLGPNANITLKNDTLQITGDYSFTAGSLMFQDEVVIAGINTFNYQTDQISTIGSASSLLIDSGITLNYAPSIASRDLIAMQDVTSQLYLNGCSVNSTIAGLRLIKGTLTIDSLNILSNAGAISLSQGICFGNGTASDDLSINILPGGQIEVISGILDYQNVN